MNSHRRLWMGGFLAAALLLAPLGATGQRTGGISVEDGMVQLDFNDVELSVVIDTISRLTGKNFIYDDRVRGRVTIVSPTRISVEEAYSVFESVLQVKGFTTVTGAGGTLKIIPIREAKESNIETLQGSQRTRVSDRYITRLIPLQFIDAEAITNTLKPLVSKDASMVAYAPTNTVILTDSASNIQRILRILESIDVETYKEQLTVIKVRHADAASMAQQLSEIFGAEVGGTAAAPTPARRTRRGSAEQAAVAAAKKGRVRIITDERTNSLIVLASRSSLEDIRRVVQRLDVPVSGGGRIHVYYLKHADAEELTDTLNALISGQPAPAARGGGAAGAAPQALRAAVTELAEGVTVTADPPTNSLVIQASQEGFTTLSEVIRLLDIPRTQVLVEALIMEVDISEGQALGFDGVLTITRGDSTYRVGSVTRSSGAVQGLSETGGPPPDDPDDPIDSATDVLSSLISAAATSTFFGGVAREGTTAISALVTAAASDARANIVSAPHILTSDNEEAEIKVGANIPIISSRVESAAGVETGLSTSVNVERQDIGVTLRVTPQISEGDQVRLQIFQQLTDTNSSLQGQVGNPEDVGVALSNREVENVVVVSDDETVVIGGLISDDYEDIESKVPWLGDIPFLGWLFKSTNRTLTKVNLLVFLTPHIVRTAEELEEQTIRKREEFWDRSQQGLQLSSTEQEEANRRRAAAEAAGLPVQPYFGRNPVRGRLLGHGRRYPVERMLEIEREEQKRLERESQSQTEPSGPAYSVLGGVFRDETAATELLTELVDAGYDGALVSSDANGTVLLEVRIGPYDTFEQAEATSNTVRDSFGLSPTVLVEPREP